METETKRTPGPWIAGVDANLGPSRFDTDDVFSAAGQPICRMTGNVAQSYDDQRFIVRAVNSHDDLVAALGRTLNALYNETHGNVDSPWICSVKANARAALAKANGDA